MSLHVKNGSSNINKNDIENKFAGLRQRTKINGDKQEFLPVLAQNKRNIAARGRPPLAPFAPLSSNDQNADKSQRAVSNKNGAIYESTQTKSLTAIQPFKNLPPRKFQVFHDENCDDHENQENNEDLDTVTIKDNLCEDQKSNEASCKPARQPLSTLTMFPDAPEESSMVVDLAFAAISDSEPGTKAESNRKFWAQFSEELLVADYAEDIYDYLRQLELEYCPKPAYMKKQPDVTCGMRSILIDWLVEVTEEYRLQKETLYLAVSYIDRFLSCMSVLRCKLQLVGTASMLIAAKFEEIYPPEVEEFVFITDDTYSQAQVLRMEQVILKVLKFDLAAPTALGFLKRFCYLLNVDEVCYHLAMYLCELTLLEADPYLQFLPSIIAGSAVCLACHTFDMDPWPKDMVKSTGYTIDDLRPCLTHVHKTYLNATDYPQQAVREKYRTEAYSSVANLNPPLTAPF